MSPSVGETAVIAAQDLFSRAVTAAFAQWNFWEQLAAGPLIIGTAGLDCSLLEESCEFLATATSVTVL